MQPGVNWLIITLGLAEGPGTLTREGCWKKFEGIMVRKRFRIITEGNTKFLLPVNFIPSNIPCSLLQSISIFYFVPFQLY